MSPRRNSNRYREPSHENRGGSWSTGTYEVSTGPPRPNSGRAPSQLERDKTGEPGAIPFSYSSAHTRGESLWSTRSRVKSPSRSSWPAPLSHAELEDKKRIIREESDRRGMSSSRIERSRPRPLSPWSQAARSSIENRPMAWSPTNSRELLPNYGSIRPRNRGSLMEETPKRDEGGYSDSRYNKVIPTAKVSKPQSTSDREAEWTGFCLALVEFVKPTVRQFWLSGVLTDTNYQEVLDKFWKKVYSKLGPAAPRTDEKIKKFISDREDLLRSYLQAFLDQYQSRD